MKNVCKYIWILAIFQLIMPLVLRSKEINLESPFKSSWYKKALDTCMHVWGDVRALSSIQDMTSKQRMLCFDALIGRLTQADMYIARLITSKMVVEEDDIVYLVHLLGLLNQACNKLNKDLSSDFSQSVQNEYLMRENEQVECMLHVLHRIKKRLEAVLGPEFILSKIEEIED